MNEIPEAPGPRLRRERERRGISLQKAADDMRLDPWAIEALESDTYDRVGPAVYAKGHLKQYASLLGVPADEIIAGYEALRLRPAAAATHSASIRVTQPRVPSVTLSWRQIAGGVALAVVAVAALWWRPWQRAPSTPTATAELAPSPPAKPAAAAAADVADVAAVAGSAPGGAPAVPKAKSSSRPYKTAAPVPTGSAPPAGLGRARLRMSFSADSWVDVRDAAGRRLFAGRGHANTVKTIGGAAPLRVYLGFASGVQLEINEHAVAIGQQFVNGDIARFQAGADGVLRRDGLVGTPPGGAPPGGTLRSDSPRDFGAPGAFTRNDAPHG
jgi:cytoskeleton protein RodZ